MVVSDTLGGKHKPVDFLKGQGVMNATDMTIVSNAVKISSNGRRIDGIAADTVVQEAGAASHKSGRAAASRSYMGFCYRNA